MHKKRSLESNETPVLI